MHDQLLKFDILGHDDPTSLLMLQNMTGKNIKDIPFHDDQVLKLYNSLESINVKPDDIMGVTIASIGLPEFGTPFARRMLYDAKPSSFGDLVRICGLAHGTNV
jgi:DNA polymerase-3 subunit alpha (Gram-positive type)